LSMQRPLPSMLIMTSCRFKVPVKSPLVNWLPWEAAPAVPRSGSTSIETGRVTP
jgi:hypothetical protein